jgi:uncharacterized delta-60 repeat protein
LLAFLGVPNGRYSTLVFVGIQLAGRFERMHWLCASRRATRRRWLARLTSLFIAGIASLEVRAQPGSLDLDFEPNAPGIGRVHSVVIQPDGKVLIGGEIGSNGQNQGIARLNSDGKPDGAFNPGSGANLSINSISLQSDAKILIGGGFTNFNGQARTYVARLNPDGSLDSNFNGQLQFGGSGIAGVLAIQITSDNKIIIGGGFPGIPGKTQRGIARLNANGSLDTDFVVGTGVAGATNSLGADLSVVTALALQADGKIVIGGNFTSVNGTPQRYLARLQSDGTVDSGFTPDVNDNISALTVQSDGRILIGGPPFSVNSVVRNGIARLNPDGSLDSSFDPGTGTGAVGSFPFVTSITVESNGRIVVGGGFSQFNDSTNHQGIARLLSNGTLDSTFETDVEGRVEGIVDAVALQTDTKILIGGLFKSVNDIARTNLARLNGDPVGSPGTNAADFLANFEWRNPLPQGNMLRGIAEGNGTVVLAGDHGTVLTSQDGATWTLHRTGATNTCSSVAFGNGTFVAVCNNPYTSSVMISTNGSDWSAQPDFAESYLTAVGFGNGTFVGVGYANSTVTGDGLRGRVVTSTDGKTWVLRANVPTALESITYGGGRFVAVGTDHFVDGPLMITSTNGIQWSVLAVPTQLPLHDVTFGNGTFVVAAGGNGDFGQGWHVYDSLITSTNGQDWIEHKISGSNVLQRVAFGNGLFAAVANGEAFTSSSGVAWTRQAIQTPLLIGDFRFVAGQFTLVGYHGEIYTSLDAKAWSRRSQGPTDDLLSISTGTNRFVTVGDGGLILSSTNGALWAPQSSGTSNRLNAVTYGNGQFVAVGMEGTILSSADGSIWTAEVSGVATPLLGTTYGNGTFVVVGAAETNGLVLTSADGHNWQKQTITNSAALFGVTAGNGLFATLGIFGIILTSPDGLTWTPRTPRTNFTELTDITFGSGIFVAGGYYHGSTHRDPIIWWSTNGTSWNAAPAWPGYQIGSPLTHVAYVGKTFVASIEDGTLVTSSDGKQWSARSSETSSSLAFAEGNGTVIAAGAGGTILQFHLASPGAMVLSARRNSGGGLVIQGGKTSEQVVIIEASTNLLQWLPIFTNSTTATQVEFVEPDSKATPGRFYRTATH